MYIDNFSEYYTQQFNSKQLSYLFNQGYQFLAIDRDMRIFAYTHCPNIRNVCFASSKGFKFLESATCSNIDNWQDSLCAIVTILEKNNTMQITVTVENSNTLKLTYKSHVLFVSKQNNQWVTLDEMSIKLSDLIEFTEFYVECEKIINTLNNEQSRDNDCNIDKFPDVLSDAIVELNNGKIVKAIKIIRQYYNCDLKTAKHIVDAILQFDYSIYDASR